MLLRAFFWGIGYCLAVTGGIHSILYLNLLATGQSFREYVAFLTQRVEFYLLPAGLFIITISIFLPSKRKRY